MQTLDGKCSHCGKDGPHHLEARSLLWARDHYRCQNCQMTTVPCRACKGGMAKVGKYWSNAFCSAHWGEQDRWKEGQLSCVSQWSSLWKEDRGLLARAASSLRPYRSDSIESFGFHKLRHHGLTAERVRVLYINGLLSQKDDQFKDWLAGAESLFDGTPSYGLRWESMRAEVTLPDASLVAGGMLAGIAAAGWKWHHARMKAEDTGRLLANVLMRTPSQEFVLCGHSLGARVIAYALLELKKANRCDVVRTAHLMGGAVGSDPLLWRDALSVCRGGIANYYSSNDDVLGYAYRPAMGFFASKPIGLTAVRLPLMRNVDVSRMVGGHTAYKENFRHFASYSMGLAG